MGQPVLAANKQAAGGILYQPNPVFGLSLPKNVFNPSLAPSIQCSGINDLANRQPVLFGQDSITECSVYYSLNDLTDSTLCTAIGNQAAQILTLTAANINSVGMFGSASVNNLGDWVTVTNTSEYFAVNLIMWFEEKIIFKIFIFCFKCYSLRQILKQAVVIMS
jgi:hypothetical protein